MNYFTVIAFKFDTPRIVVQAEYFDVIDGCLVFFDATHNSKLAYAKEYWNKVRISSDEEILAAGYKKE